VPLALDVDATLITAHSDKELAAPTYKRGYGQHPIWVFADHGQDGTGEPLAVMLRPGNAGSNTAADHIAVVCAALRQLPGTRRGKQLLVRADGAGATHEFLNWLTARRLSYSVGFTRPTRSRRHWRGCRKTAGLRPTTATARSATAPGSPTSPACSTSRRGQRGCG
jgi:hypothetical protein